MLLTFTEIAIEVAAKKGEGRRFINPNNKHDSVRVMIGNPKSSNPAQRNHYVKRLKDGKHFDKDGNPASGSSPEAHIPLREFRFK